MPPYARVPQSASANALRLSSHNVSDSYSRPPLPSRNYDSDDIPRYYPSTGRYSDIYLRYF